MVLFSCAPAEENNMNHHLPKKCQLVRRDQPQARKSYYERQNCAADNPDRRVSNTVS
jgi:hypothetical protein